MAMALSIPQSITRKAFSIMNNSIMKPGASKREIQIKRWSRAKKEALVAGDKEKLRSLSRSHDYI